MNNGGWSAAGVYEEYTLRGWRMGCRFFVPETPMHQLETWQDDGSQGVTTDYVNLSFVVPDEVPDTYTRVRVQVVDRPPAAAAPRATPTRAIAPEFARRLLQPDPYFIRCNPSTGEADATLMITQPWQTWECATPPERTRFLGELRSPYSPQSRGGLDVDAGPYLSQTSRVPLPDAWARAVAQGRAMVKGHADAIDYEASIYVGNNGGGRQVFRGPVGFAPVPFAIPRECVAEELPVTVHSSDRCTDLQPLGKQVRPGQHPRECLYRQTSGVCGPMYLELARSGIERARYYTNADGSITVRVWMTGNTHNLKVHTVLSAGGVTIGEATRAAGERVEFTLKPAHMPWWSPYQPGGLIEVTHYVTGPGGVQEMVEGYFGARLVDARQDRRGRWRIAMNGHELPLAGVLVQGYDPDSLYWPSSPEKMAGDIDKILALGFNFIRYHQNVPPAQFAALCDMTGLTWALEGPTWGAKDENPALALVILEAYLRALSRFANSPALIMLNPLNETTSTTPVPILSRALMPHMPPGAWLYSNVSGFRHEQYSGRQHTQLWLAHLYDLTGGKLFKDLENLRRLVPADVSLHLGEFDGIGCQVDGKENLFFYGHREGDNVPRTLSQAMDRRMSLWNAAIDAYELGMVTGLVGTQYNDTEQEENGLVLADGRDKYAPELLQPLTRVIADFTGSQRHKAYADCPTFDDR
jgi:hypothetical protein